MLASGAYERNDGEYGENENGDGQYKTNHRYHRRKHLGRYVQKITLFLKFLSLRPRCLISITYA